MRSAVYLLPILLLVSALFAASPFEGTWQENVAKSKYGGPDKPPKEGKVIIQEQGGRLVVTVKATSAEGHWSIRKAHRQRGVWAPSQRGKLIVHLWN